MSKVTAIQTRFNGTLSARGGKLATQFCPRASYPCTSTKKEPGWRRAVNTLPDFWLPSLGLWLEVKSELPTPKETYKCHCLADETHQKVVIACGNPASNTMLGCFSPGWGTKMGIQNSARILNAMAPSGNGASCHQSGPIGKVRVRWRHRALLAYGRSKA